MKKDESRIPKGMYCQDKQGTCPYWSYKVGLPERESGYCSFLEKSDWDLNEERGDMKWFKGKTKEYSHTTKAHDVPNSLLWDKVKECNKNMEEEQN